MIDITPRSSQLRIQNGVAYTFLDLASLDRASIFVGEIHAAGQGTLKLRTSTCLRPPNSSEKGFSHAIKKEVERFTLSEEVAVFRFALPLEAYERGYLYIHVAGEAVISHVSAVAVEQ